MASRARHTVGYDAATGDDTVIAWNTRGLPDKVTLGPSETPTARDEFRYGPDGGRYYRKVTWQEETTDPDTEETTTRTRTAHVYRIGGYERVVGDAHAAHAVVEKTRAGAALQVSLRQTSSSTPAAAFEYLHTDHLGTTAAATNATGASLLALAHDPYGTRRKADWTAQLPESDVSAIAAGQDAGRTRRGFTGHEQLDRTGLVHMGGRLYDPRTGRFLSPDPVVSEPWSGQSWNLYSYVGNSPLSYADPTGLFRAGPGCNVAAVMCLDDGGGPGGGFPDETTTLTSTRFGFGFLPRPVYSFQWIALPGSLAPGGDVWGSRGFPGGFAVASLTYVSTPYAWTDVRSQRMVADGGPHPADGPMASRGGSGGSAATRPVAFVGGGGDNS